MSRFDALHQIIDQFEVIQTFLSKMRAVVYFKIVNGRDGILINEPAPATYDKIYRMTVSLFIVKRSRIVLFADNAIASAHHFSYILLQ